MSSILQLAPYPIRRPLHGGQHRVRAIHDRLAAEGHNVRTVSVVVEGFYPGEDHDPHTVVVPRSTMTALGIPPVCYDLGLERLLHNGPRLVDAVLGAIGGFTPDLVMLEQPWLRPIISRLRPGLPVVYSSQNVESTLKRAILLGSAEVRPIAANALVGEIEALERTVAEEADVVVVVSGEDAAWYAPFSRKVVVAKNGSTRRKSTPAVAEQWRETLRGFRIALFVGSGHPPNADGFWKMLGPSLGFLPPPARIVVVGGVGPTLLPHPLAKTAPSSNAARINLVGLQSEAALGALLEVADCILLPITAGGGTNLKTAEALLSGKTVITTTKALRGFEDFAHADGVIVADTAEAFRLATLEVLSSPQPSADWARPESQQLLWDATLEPLVSEVTELTARSVSTMADRARSARAKTVAKTMRAKDVRS